MNKFIENNLKNIVFIGIKKQIGDQQGINIRGSGFVLDSGFIVTCAHVYNEIPEEEKIRIFLGVMEKSGGKINNYKFYDMELIDKDDKRDIALFKTIDRRVLSSGGFGKESLMSEKEIELLQLGADLQYVGFPLMNELLGMGMGITMIVNQCILASIKFSNIDNKIDFMLIDKWVNPGSSGSPVFSGDRIIGIASGTLNKTHTVGETSLTAPLGIGVIRTSNYILELLNKDES